MKKLALILSFLVFAFSESIGQPINMGTAGSAVNLQQHYSGLIAYFPLDTTSMKSATIVADASGHGYNGSITAGASNWFMNDHRSVANSAMDFDGADTKIDCGSDFIGTQALTITGWIYADSWGEGSSGTVGYILTNGKTTFSIQSTFGEPNNNLRFTSSGGSASTAPFSAANSISLNTWYHIGISRAAGTDGVCNFYINGILSGDANQSSGTPEAGTINVIIGNRTVQDITFDGRQADIRVYYAVKSATWMWKDYQLYKPAFIIHDVFVFNNIANTTSNLKLNKSGTNAWVDWGDGKQERVSKTEYTSHTYAAAYTGEVRIWSDDGNPITHFYSNVNNYNFDIADLTASLPNLTYIYIAGYNTISGDIANAPVNLTYILITGSNTISGDIANAPVNLTFIAIYGSNAISGDIANAPVNLTYILITGSNTMSGDIANAPVNLTYIAIAGSNTLSGDIANAPVNLTFIAIYGSNTLSGDIANAPVNLTFIRIYGYNTISGDIANAPVNLTYIAIYGYNTISGDIANAPVNLIYINIGGSNTISAYTAGRTWANNQRYIHLVPAAGSGLDATEVDNLLIDLALVASWTTEKVVWLAGNNAARTAASDAAVATLQGKGVEVTTN